LPLELIKRVFTDAFMTSEEQDRIDAIARHTKGEKAVTIYQDLKRSKRWFFKWLNRSKTGNETWYKSQSKAPKNHGKAIPSEMEEAVVSIRKALMDGTEEEYKYLGVGADAIHYRMNKLAFPKDEVPSVSTVKRVIKRHGLKVNKRERPKRVGSKKRYTLLNPTQINEVQEMDFVGPRFIKRYGAISSLHLIDVVANQVRVRQYRSKSMDNVIEFCVQYWREGVMPRYLQVDNGMSFIGDYHTPRNFSRFIRLCLYVGIELVFIAPREPWMNGSIENFNGWFNTKFWTKEMFKDLEDMCLKSQPFETQFNDLNTWKNRNKGLEKVTPERTLKSTIEIDYNELPLTEGKIHFIRKVDADGKVGVLNEQFKIGGEFIGEFVWTTICLTKQRRTVYYQAQDEDVARAIQEAEYKVKEEVKPINEDLWTS